MKNSRLPVTNNINVIESIVMNSRKKLIEVALPLEAINEASAYEKFMRHGHPSSFHLWWARRPIVSARAVIFASLVDDPDNSNASEEYIRACNDLPKGRNAKTEDTPRQRLFDFIEQLTKWENTNNEEILSTALKLINICADSVLPSVLDPFAGGGAIPLEAQRLGLKAHASDLNPIPITINKALIEIPARFVDLPPANPDIQRQLDATAGWKGLSGLANDVAYYGYRLRDRVWEQIGHLYPKGPTGETVIAWLWARTVKCPNPACGAQMPLAASFDLSTKRGKKAWIEPIIDRQAKTVSFVVKTGDGKSSQTPKVGHGAKFKCLVCDEVAPADYLKEQGITKSMGAQLMAIICEGEGSRSYLSPTKEHEEIAKQAIPAWSPTGGIGNDPRAFTCILYGLTDFADLYTNRQLLALSKFVDEISEIRNIVYRDAINSGFSDDSTPLRDGGKGALAYAEAISVYLGFAVDQLANHSSAICGWHPGNSQMRNAFTRQAIPIIWDYAESNPFCESSGSFHSLFGRLIKAFESLPGHPQGLVEQRDAANPFDGLSKFLICTDPPYYDNVPYANLSDYFYVWLRRSIGNVYPDVFSTMLVPKEPELVADQYRLGSRKKAQEHFEKGLQQVFRNLRSVADLRYPVTIFYAFKQAESLTASDGMDTAVSTGWETMLASLIEAGFAINGTWPMRTELTTGVKVIRNALASSIVLVCRPRPEDAPTTSRRAFMDDLRRELPAALKDMQSGNIAPVDLAQASIGPGMAIYSRYSRVLEADGSAMSVRTALGLINAALDEYLAEQDGDIDPDTRFAVDWFTQFGFNEGEFGLADVLARAKNTSVAGVESAGLVLSGRGKVKLKHWSEYDPGAWDPTQDKRPTVWEATHHLIERLNSHGETGSAMLMQKMPSDMAAEARQLAYRLYSICERKGWADHARDYNALVISWSGIGEEAARLRDAVARGDATTQLNLFDDEA